MAIDAHLEFCRAALQRFVISPFPLHPLLRVEANAAPLSEQPEPNDLKGLIHIAYMEREGKTLRHAGFAQQAARLGPRLGEIGPVASDVPQFLERRCQGVPREDNATNSFHNSNL